MIPAGETIVEARLFSIHFINPVAEFVTEGCIPPKMVPMLFAVLSRIWLLEIIIIIRVDNMN